MGSTITSRSVILTDVRDTFLVLAAASLLPLLMHLVPSYSQVPSGARFLPIFYAPFIGIVLFRARVGIVAGILAPALNSMITGRPDVTVISVLTVDLAMFTIIISLIYSRWKRFWAVGPLAYIIAKFISSVIFSMRLDFISGEAALQYFYKSIMIAVPGLVILLLMGYIAIRYKESA